VKPVLRPLPDNASGTPRLTVCVNDRGENAISPSCGPRGGAALEAAIRDAVGASGFDCEVQTIRCLGLCEKGPNVRLAPGNNWFHDVTPDDASELVAAAAAHMAERG
jgi:(2Fe-2S) ferredoxin